MAETKLARHTAAETHPSGERVVVFHSLTQDSIVLNPTGTWLWNQLESPKSESELIESLKQEFPDVDPEVLVRDLKAYLEELKKNLLVITSA